MRGPLAAAVCALAVIASLLVATFAASADAAPFVWSGEAAAGSRAWSAGGNWQGGVAPSVLGPVALEFPRLTGAACTASPPQAACYHSSKDLGDLAIESLRIDDGDEYELEGEPFTLGAGGLTAAPAGTAGAAGDVIGMPVDLSASQTWSVSGREHGGQGENGVLLAYGISGEGDPLTVDLANGAGLYLEGDTETGPLTIAKAGEGARGIFAFAGSVNSRDRDPVSVSDALLLGDGPLGPVTARSAQIVPAPRLEATSVSLDSGSEVTFDLVGVLKSVVQSELVSGGAVSLGGAKLTVEAGPASSPYGTCPALSEGQTFTLVSTTGTLSGFFGNAHEGWEIPIELTGGCAGPWSLRIAYHESGETKTVTGTAVFGLPEEPPVPNTVTPYVIPTPPPRIFNYLEAPPPAPQAAIARSRVLLTATRLRVQGGEAQAKLRCVGSSGTCEGTLLLTTRVRSKRGRRAWRTLTLGEARFSIAAGRTRVVEIKLAPRAKGMLDAHRSLQARLEIATTSPPPGGRRSVGVRLGLIAPIRVDGYVFPGFW